jgi:hypothetical protein
MTDKPKYEWLPTGLGRADDYCGWDGGIRFGRIYKYHMGFWYWHLNGMKLGSANGQEDTGRAAALALERAYDRVKDILIADGRFDAIPRIPRP